MKKIALIIAIAFAAMIAAPSVNFAQEKKEEKKVEAKDSKNGGEKAKDSKDAKDKKKPAGKKKLGGC